MRSVARDCCDPFPAHPYPRPPPSQGEGGQMPHLVHRSTPRARKPRGLTASLRGISQEILAHHGPLLSTPKDHQELLLALCQRHVLWTNPLHPCPCRDRRC